MCVENVYLSYYSELRKYAENILKSDEIAKDVVQDVFISLINHSTEIDFSKSLKPLLYKMTYNRSIDILRSPSYRQISLNDSNFKIVDPESLFDTISNSDYELFLLSKLSEAILDLPPRCREVVTLRAKSMKNRDIASYLNISIKTVEKHITQAFIKIRSSFVNI